MKLQNLLAENDKNKLLGLLTSGEYYGVQRNQRLFRGGESVDKFRKIKIQERPEPRNTSKLIDEIVEAVRKEYYPEAASRQKSIFVTGKADVARGYGEAAYVFVPKSANCWWSANDAYTDYFARIEELLPHIGTIAKHGDSDESYLIKFGEAVANENVNKASKTAAEIFGDVMKADVKTSSDELLVQVKKTFNYISQYFESLNEYDGDMQSRHVHEILVGGGHVILAEKNWFNSTIEPKFYRKQRK